jgi:hypothetical protein
VAFAGCFGFSLSGTLAGGMAWVGLGKKQGDLSYGAEGYSKNNLARS